MIDRLSGPGARRRISSGCASGTAPWDSFGAGIDERWDAGRVLGTGGAMRYNDKELQALSRQPAEMAAELGMRGPKKGSGERSGTPERAGGRLRGREWAGAEPARSRLVLAVVKRRLVKLVVNFLFYFRTDEAEVGWWGGPK